MASLILLLFQSNLIGGKLHSHANFYLFPERVRNQKLIVINADLKVISLWTLWLSCHKFKNVDLGFFVLYRLMYCNLYKNPRKSPSEAAMETVTLWCANRRSAYLVSLEKFSVTLTLNSHPLTFMPVLKLFALISIHRMTWEKIQERWSSMPL